MRDLHHVDEWREAVHRTTDALSAASVLISNDVRMGDPLIAELVQIRRLTWTVRDHYGLQCSMLRPNLASNTPLGARELEAWSGDRAIYQTAWRSLDELLLRPGSSQALQRRVATAQNSTHDAQAAIDEVVARLNDTGRSPVAGDRWTALCNGPFEGDTDVGNRAPPFVSGQPLTTDTATYDIIGRTWYVGFKTTFGAPRLPHPAVRIFSGFGIAMLTTQQRREKLYAVFRVASGNFLEMYDFMVFGYFSAAIGRAYFPASSDFASLMFSLTTFAVGFMVRPLGAIFLGAYIDHAGRRKGLLVTLALMSVGTLTVAAVPTYASIGVLAPVIVVMGRLCQGFSAGVELGGVSVYLAEIATPGNKGFYVSWQSSSQQVAVIFAGVLGYLLSTALPPEDLDRWGWRVPLLVGCLIVPFIYFIRRTLQETDEFAARKVHPSVAQVYRGLAAHWRVILPGVAMVLMTTVCFYTITAYTPTFGKSVLHLSQSDALLVTLCVGVSNLVWLPIMGRLSDKVGRRPLLRTFAGLALLTAYPVMAWLACDPTFYKLLAVELWLSLIFAGYNGALVVYLVELVPADLRTAEFSLAYSLATTIGGSMPAVATYLIHATGNRAMPGAWLSVAAAIALLALPFTRTQGAALPGPHLARAER